MTLLKVISGGQTGVDRAALDAALACGIPIGGFVPKGRKSEDGKVPGCYPMTELTTGDYKVRTRKNIEESDETLVIIGGWPISPGTALTMDMARILKKNYMFVSHRVLHDKITVLQTKIWLQNIKTLNVAGPRESKCPGIYQAAYDFLIQVFGETTK